MFKKILIILYICIIGTAIYFIAEFFIARENTDSTESADRAKDRTEKISEQDNVKINPEESIVNDDAGDSNDDSESTEVETTITQEDAAYNITNSDCANGCDDYTDDEKDYCRNICGLTGSTSEEKNCDELSGLQKDYCIKDNAINNNSIDDCKKIEDSGVYNQCINRITEEFIDQIM